VKVASARPQRRPRHVRLLRNLTTAALLALVAACATVPITGRSQLSLVSDEAMIALADQQFSWLMDGFRRNNQVLSPSESDEAAKLVTTVERINQRLAEASGLASRYRVETTLIKSRQRNAFVLFNGKTFVYTGLLEIAKDEAGLAAVIGHEMGHVVARHGAERLSQKRLVEVAIVAAVAADVILAAKDPRHRPLIGAAVGLGAIYGVLRPFSRAHELEADRLGLVFMAKAGYDPTAAVGLWERMEARQGSGVFEFLSTHPGHGTRRRQIEAWLPEARRYYAEARTTTTVAALAPQHSIRSPEAVSGVPVAAAALAAPSPVFEHPRDRQGRLLAYPPALPVGYWYETQAEGQKPAATRIEQIEDCGTGKCYVTVGESGPANVLTSELALSEIRYADGTSSRFLPPMPQFRWPLKVGERWSETVTVRRWDGSTQTMLVHGEVNAFTQVDTLAGSFSAFEIRLFVRGSLAREYWYAPEIGTVVKSRGPGSEGSSLATSVLRDYDARIRASLARPERRSDDLTEEILSVLRRRDAGEITPEQAEERKRELLRAR
jgi:metalloendopeptidase OMA1, mitochondrial